MTVQEGASKAWKSTKGFFTGGSAISKIVIAILVLFAFVLIIHIISGMYQRIQDYKYNQIWINDGKTICPKTALTVSGKDFHLSKNELGGLEFTYAFWIYIQDFTFKHGQWKHILHKGNQNSWPNRAPGIWLHPKENAMRFYMNTFDSIAGNYIDIDNIPIQKWFHVVVTVNQLTMDVYINGNLKKSHKFTSMPKQNFGDVFIMNNRGFDGYLSRMVYYNYNIPYSEIDSLVSQGPNIIDCGMKEDIPRYLTPNWWTSN